MPPNVRPGKNPELQREEDRRSLRNAALKVAGIIGVAGAGFYALRSKKSMQGALPVSIPSAASKVKGPRVSSATGPSTAADAAVQARYAAVKKQSAQERVAMGSSVNSPQPSAPSAFAKPSVYVPNGVPMPPNVPRNAPPKPEFTVGSGSAQAPQGNKPIRTPKQSKDVESHTQAEERAAQQIRKDRAAKAKASRVKNEAQADALVKGRTDAERKKLGLVVPKGKAVATPKGKSAASVKAPAPKGKSAAPVYEETEAQWEARMLKQTGSGKAKAKAPSVKPKAEPAAAAGGVDPKAWKPKGHKGAYTEVPEQHLIEADNGAHMKWINAQEKIHGPAAWDKRHPIHKEYKKLQARLRMRYFHNSLQIVDENNRYSSPLRSAAGLQQGYVRNRESGGLDAVHLPLNHAQVVRSAYNEGKGIYKWGNRAAGLGKDTAAVIRGEPRERDPWGRVRKREWEKPWFTNAAGAAIAGGAVLGGAAILAHHAPTRELFSKGVAKYRAAKERIMPNSFAAKMVYRLLSQQGKLTMLDETAGDWDVRDARGRSARVFAPGARARERREKKWYEKSANQKRLAVAAAAIAATGGVVGGYALRGYLKKTGANPVASTATPIKASVASPKMEVSRARGGFRSKITEPVSANEGSSIVQVGGQDEFLKRALTARLRNLKNFSTQGDQEGGSKLKASAMITAGIGLAGVGASTLYHGRGFVKNAGMLRRIKARTLQPTKINLPNYGPPKPILRTQGTEAGELVTNYIQAAHNIQNNGVVGAVMRGGIKATKKYKKLLPKSITTALPGQPRWHAGPDHISGYSRSPLESLRHDRQEVIWHRAAQKPQSEAVINKQNMERHEQVVKKVRRHMNATGASEMDALNVVARREGPLDVHKKKSASIQDYFKSSAMQNPPYSGKYAGMVIGGGGAMLAGGAGLAANGMDLQKNKQKQTS